MSTEQTLAEWVAETRYEDLPPEAVAGAKLILRTIVGTTIAGSSAEGCGEVLDLVAEWGGAEEATVLVHGGRVPARSAAFVNSVMARAFDICEGANPGVHAGSSVVPVALAVAELAGGCSGEELIAAIAVGSEVTFRMARLLPSVGWDPTGVATPFGAAATAGRLLGLDSQQMLHALALAFNRSGSSFQSNIDGTLAVRLIQGWVAEGGVVCAQLAQRGMTGPKNFLNGSCGYAHLFAQDQCDVEDLLRGLGSEWYESMMFKAYPSCGATIGSTDAALKVRAENGLSGEDVEKVELRMTPPAYLLVGHRFEIGDNPTVNAQFNASYCVANALVHGSSELEHFVAEGVHDAQVGELAGRVDVVCDSELNEGRPELNGRVRIAVTRGDGRVVDAQIDHPSGMPGNPMSPEQHLARFWSDVEYGNALPRATVQEIVDRIEGLEHAADARELVALMLPETVAQSA